jgi:antibiotic biosynthesis monooxygenase (ABM) superfamily enzyme
MRKKSKAISIHYIPLTERQIDIVDGNRTIYAQVNMRVTNGYSFWRERRLMPITKMKAKVFS